MMNQLRIQLSLQHLLLLSVYALGSSQAAFSQSAVDEPQSHFVPLVSIKDLMEKTITPATNTIWRFYEPPTELSEWIELEEAAVSLLAAISVNAAGGVGPNDNEWAQKPTWKAFNSTMLQAATDALTAIRAQDHDALLLASDVLYPPCEGCHLQFNPGVIEAP